MRWAVAAPGALAVITLALATQASAADPKQPRVAGQDVPAPKLEKSVTPEYSSDAEARGLGGIVIVSVLIDEEGRVASADVVRGIPGLDASALAAVRQWRFSVTRVDGQPVRVQHVVSVSFAHRLPLVTRSRDVPELRQGVTPRFPPTPTTDETADVALTLLIDENGHVTAVGLASGMPPWTDSLITAVRTWRFAPETGRAPLSLRLDAHFVTKIQSIDLKLSRLTSSDQPLAGGAAPISANSGHDAPSSPGSADGSSASTQHDHAAAPPPDAEVIPSALPPPTSTPPPPGISAVESVVLGPGVPDLILGRRPVVPPLARLERLSGTVKVVFSVDMDGRTTIHQVDGVESLRAAAEGAVRTWSFRPLTAERVFLIATFAYDSEAVSAVATVGRRDLGL